jgi:isopropylmalate/homocitrate/citramalate synthase
MLDEFGIDYVEGGYPGANPTDTAFLRAQAYGEPRNSSPSA